MKHATLLFFVLGAILLLGLIVSSIFPISPLPMTSASSGEEMASVYCVSCHGRNASGVSAPDLTTLAKRNHGKFPTLLVKETIRGEARVDAMVPKICRFGASRFATSAAGAGLKLMSGSII
jgi:cytochrome c553